jgi:hypothetical protein
MFKLCTCTCVTKNIIMTAGLPLLLSVQASRV